MLANIKNVSSTKVELTISGDDEDLKKIKKITLKRLQPEVSAPGFRKGKVPINVVEKQVDDRYLQSQFLDDALTLLYQRALAENDIRPVDRPEVELKSFVPYTEITFIVKVEIVPAIKLADYKKISVKPEKISVTSKDVDEVIESLRKRLASFTDVERAAKKGDKAIIDFEGTDEKGEKVAGASGKDYPLDLGSSTFIDGFEDNVIGMKPGDEKAFTLTFPKDYAHKPLANKDVTFTVTLNKVQESKLPEVDAAFAKQVGPFKSVEELKTDVEAQLKLQKEDEADAKLKDKIVEELVSKSSLDVPESLVQENIESLLNDFKQNLVYRGITYDEYLDQAGQTDDDYREKELRKQAEQRVRVGLVLSEVAKKEEIHVHKDELSVRMQLLKQQYQNDPALQSQLDTPETEQEIASRMITEQTVAKLVEYATSKK